METTLPPGISVNLVPFDSIRELIARGPNWPTVRLLAGNVAVFVPFGLLAPVAWRRLLGFGPTVLAGLSLSLGIECAQFALSLHLGHAYRVAEVDDVLLNVSGVMLGWAAMRGGLRARPAVASPPRGCYPRREPRTPG
jgi:glycopeptide antibiotics resistance protein